MNLLTRDISAGNLGQTAEDELRQIPFLNTEGKNYHSADQQGFSIRFCTCTLLKKGERFSSSQAGMGCNVTNQTLGKIAYLCLQCTTDKSACIVLASNIKKGPIFQWFSTVFIRFNKKKKIHYFSTIDGFS
jgi:hypothetical protein